MFKNAFSSGGRIRRKEFCLSFLICSIVVTLLQYFLFDTLGHYSSNQDSSLLILVLFVPCFVFLITQSAKRCHDLGKSGWYQLIPFYVFWLMFADSQWGVNEYGLNPKGHGNTVFSFETETAADDIS